MTVDELAAILRKLADMLEDHGEVTPKSGLERIMTEVGAAYSVTADEMRSPTRARHVHAARVEAYSRMRNELGWSYKAIGQYFNRDHSTVVQALS